MRNRKFPVLLGVVLGVVLASCGTATTTETQETSPPSQPDMESVSTSMGLGVERSSQAQLAVSQLMAEQSLGETQGDYQFFLEEDTEALWRLLEQGEAEVLLLPSNLAAQRYHEVGDITLVAVTNYGGISLLERGQTLATVTDLAGKTIHATGAGEANQYVLERLLRLFALDPQSLEILWHSKGEMTALLAEETEGIFLVDSLQAQQALYDQDDDQDDDQERLRQVFSLSQPWSDLVGGLLPVGAVVVENQFLEEQPEAVAEFLAELQASITLLKEGDQAQVLVDAGLVSHLAVGEQVLAEGTLGFVTGASMQSQLQSFYVELFQGNPLSVGGGLPYDDFYGVAEER